MINDDFSDLQLLLAEHRIDREAMFAAIVVALRGSDSNAAHRRIADYLDPSSDTTFKLELSFRNDGNPQQLKRRQETLETLTEIFRSTRDPKNFVARAESATGLSTKTINKWRPEVEKRAEELDEIEREAAEHNRRRQLEELERICAFAQDDDTAVCEAHKILGMREDGVRKYLEWRKARGRT